MGENTGHIDNTSDGAGVVKELVFDSDIVPHHFDATVYYCDKENVRLTDADLRAAVSPKYESRKVTEMLLNDDFSDYANETSIIGSNGWSSRGSAISATKLTDTDGGSYLNFKGNDKSQYLFRSLGKTINSGKLEIRFKARYVSGSAAGGIYSVTGIETGETVEKDTEITIVPVSDEGYEVDKVYAYATTGGSASEETEVSKTGDAYKTTVTEDTTITVTFKEVQQPITHTYIPLLSAFDSKIQIEKTNAVQDTATLTVSLKDGVSAEVPALTAYIAVYSGVVLKEVRTEVFDSETGVVNITKPTGLGESDSYKIFIWAENYEPVTEPITASLFEQ